MNKRQVLIGAGVAIILFGTILLLRCLHYDRITSSTSPDGSMKVEVFSRTIMPPNNVFDPKSYVFMEFTNSIGTKQKKYEKVEDSPDENDISFKWSSNGVYVELVRYKKEVFFSK